MCFRGFLGSLSSFSSLFVRGEDRKQDTSKSANVWAGNAWSRSHGRGLRLPLRPKGALLVMIPNKGFIIGPIKKRIMGCYIKGPYYCKVPIKTLITL